MDKKNITQRNKGFIQIAFLPILLSAGIGVAILGFFGWTLQKTGSTITTTFTKIALILLAVGIGFVVLKNQIGNKKIDTTTIAFLLLAIGILLFVLISSGFTPFQIYG